MRLSVAIFTLGVSACSPQGGSAEMTEAGALMAGLAAHSRAEQELHDAQEKDLNAQCEEAGLDVHALQSLASGEETLVQGCAGALGKESMQAFVDVKSELYAVPFAISGAGQVQLIVSDLVDGYVAELAQRSFVLAAGNADGIFFVAKDEFKNFTSAVRMFAGETPESPRYLLSNKKALSFSVNVLALTAAAKQALKR